MDDLEFELKMIDRLSGPSKQMQQALAAVDKGLKAQRAEITATEASLRSLSKATVVDATTKASLTKQLQSQRNAFAASNVALHQHGVSAHEAASAARELASEERKAAREAEGGGAALEKLGDKAKELALALFAVEGAKKAFEFAGFVAEAADAKAEVMASLSLVLDTKEAAAETYEQLEKISSRLGVSGEATESVARALATAGVSGQEALVAAVSAVQTAEKALPGAGEKIQRIIEKAGGSGFLKVGKNTFTNAGVSLAQFVDQLSKDTGKSVAVLKAQLKKGGVEAEIGTKALVEAVHLKLDPIALALAGTWGSSLTRLKTSLKTIFDKVDVKPFEKALSRVVDLFDHTTASGQNAEGVLVPVFDRIFGGLTAAVKGARHYILILELAFYDLYNQNEEFKGVFDGLFPPEAAEGAKNLATNTKDVAASFKSALEDTAKLITAMEKLYKAAKLVAGVFKVVTDSFDDVMPDYLAEADKRQAQREQAEKARLAGGAAPAPNPNFDAKAAVQAAYGDSPSAAGKGVSDGFARGITDGTADVAKAAEASGKAAVEGFRRGTDSHSPSRKTMMIGRDMSRGLEIGAEQRHPERHLQLVAARSVVAMASVAPQAISPRSVGQSSSSPQAPSGPSRSVDLSGMRIEINGVEGAEDVPELLMPMFADLFERAGLTLGTRPSGSGKAA
jgi:hypothetical protein